MAHVWNILDGNIYVSKNGNDTTGDGSMANPYASINKATTIGANGNKIVIGTGVWQENRGSSTNFYNFCGDGEVKMSYNLGIGFNPYITSSGFGDSCQNLIFMNNNVILFNTTYSGTALSQLPLFYNCVIELIQVTGGLQVVGLFRNCLIGSILVEYDYKRTQFGFINCTIKKIMMKGSYQSYFRFYEMYNNVIEESYIHDAGYNGCLILISIPNYNLINKIVIDQAFYSTTNIKGLNPQFNNASIGDYTLQPTSPCLFAGKNNATIGAFGLGYSFNPNSSVFTKEGGATFSASSGTDDIVRASQTINGIATYMFNLNAGKLSGTVESAWIDLQAIRYLLTTRLFANLIYNATGVATSRPDNSETAGEKAVYYDFEFKYCLTEAEKAAATWKAVIWNKAVTIDNSNRGNADAAFVASEAKYISARFVKIKLYMKES